LSNLQILVIENSLLMDETSSPFTLFIKSTQSCSKGRKKTTGGIFNIEQGMSNDKGQMTLDGVG